jgi:redox-sensitive bicupin YhaK (pirin superfamily)
MYKIRKSQDRGHANHGWLESYHSFSFADYYDPSFMGHSVLRVINEDFIAPKTGFPAHGHRDMEIITYVITGAIEHRDSLGNVGLIRPGEIQRMSAGNGIQHSEMSASATETTRLLQIWLLPDSQGYPADYEQVDFSAKHKLGELLLIASKTREAGSLLLRQDAKLYAGQFQAGTSLTLPLTKNRQGWLQMIDGQMSLEGQSLLRGDGLIISHEQNLKLQVEKEAHFLFFDLP